MASATIAQVLSSRPSKRRKYVVVRAKLLWSEKRETPSSDSAASRRSFAAECRKTCTPAGGRPLRQVGTRSRQALPQVVPASTRVELDVPRVLIRPDVLDDAKPYGPYWLAEKGPMGWSVRNLTGHVIDWKLGLRSRIGIARGESP